MTVIDAKTRKVIKTIGFAVPGVQPENIQPVGVRVTKDGSKAFVALGPANRVAVIDAKTFEVEKYLLVGQRVWQLAFTPDEALLFVTNGNSNDVSVIDVPNSEGDQVDPGRHRALGRGDLAAVSEPTRRGNAASNVT